MAAFVDGGEQANQPVRGSGRAALVERVVAVAERLRHDELVMAVLRSESALVYIAQRLGRSQQMLIDALADNLRAAQRDGSVRPGDPQPARRDGAADHPIDDSVRRDRPPDPGRRCAGR